MKKPMLKTGFRLAVIFAAFIAAVLIVAFGTSHRAFADSENSVVLSPIEIGSDIDYHLFDAPTSVYADPSGMLVSEESTVKSISNDGVIEIVREELYADKVYRTGNYIITLEDGCITSYYGNDGTTFDEYDIVDIDIEDNTLYGLTADGLVTITLGENAIDINSAKYTPFSSDAYKTIKASSFAVLGGNVFVAVNSAIFKNKHDIVSVDVNGNIEQIFMQSDIVLSMSAMDYSEILYTATQSGILGYKMGAHPELAYSAQGEAFTDIFAFDGYIYALDALDGIQKLSSDLSVQTSMIASASDAEGFFNMPSGVALKNSTMYVADTVNDRVAAYTSSAVHYLDGEFVSPVSVAGDSTGAVYIAHSFNEVVKITPTGQTTITVDGFIKQIAVDADKTLYILTRDGLWAADDHSAVKISDKPYKAITLAAGRDELYALDNTSVKKLTVSDGKTTEFEYCAADPTAFSLAVDLNGTVFTLSPSYITRIAAYGSESAQFSMTVDGKPYELGFSSGDIALCTVDSVFVPYGDLVIVDSYKHRVLSASGTTLGVKLIDDDYDVPAVKDDTNPTIHNSGLIRVTLYDTPVFSLPMETPSVYTIAKGRKVIVAQYELEESREYSLILIDNLSTGELLQGYVYRDSLSAPLPYVAPPASSGAVYASATPVYKWPSPNSKAVTGFGAVERATQFEILDFVQEYRDDYNNLWYRIRITGQYEGYILAANMSVLGYDPIFIRPAYDAEIISYKGSTFAQAYQLVDGEYKEIDVTFATGTQVEVVGKFDTSVEYTQIKYLDPEYGTLTCYVKTVYLKYKGVNIVLIVAIIVIIVTVILAAIIIGRVIYLKKKRLTTRSV
ncbi:MAG: hypothetical protein J1G04_04340 [Clostridiales bacterium]|nr:hypothetical protein [Clostridiales bacterium]